MYYDTLKKFTRIYIARVIGIVIAFATNIWIAKQLGPYEFGIYSQIMSVGLILSTFVLAGGVNRNLKGLSEGMDVKIDDGFGIFIDSLSLTMLLGICLIPIFIFFTASPSTWILALWFGVGLAIFNLGITFFKVRISLTKSEIWLHIIRPGMFLGLAGMCFLLYQRVSAAFLILVQLFVLVALGLFIFSYIVPFLKTEKILNPQRIFQETKKKERLNFWVNGAFQILLLNAPIILYIYADAPEKSGYASLALKFSMAFLVPVQVFGAIIEPEIAGKFKAREFAKIRKQFYFLLIQNILIMIPIFIIFMLHAGPLIQFLVGEEYLPGVNIIKVIVAAFFISSLVGPVGVYLNLTGYARIMTGVTFISVLLLCVLSVFLLEAPVEAVFFSVFSSQFCILFLILLYLMHFSWPRMKFDND